MRLTRRGWGVVAVCALGFGLAATFGARSLNAIVLPGLVALAAAYLQVRSLPEPTVRRELPPDDSVGATHRATLRFPDVERPFPGRLRDRLDVGLAGEGNDVETAVGSPITYEVTYRRRGERTVGPVEIVGRDVLGLAEATVVAPRTAEILVYPRAFALGPGAQRDLLALRETERSDERSEFDRLREYVRGDALRDVHWKSSARRESEGLIVKEFGATGEAEVVTVAGSAASGAADDLAEAAASVSLALLDADVPVALVLPNGSAEADPDIAGRTRLLEHCARATEGGPNEAADVAIEADGDGVRVRIGDATVAFAELRGRRERSVAHPDTDDASRPETGSAEPGSGSESDAADESEGEEGGMFA